MATSPCTQLPVMTLQASSFSSQLYKTSRFFYWASLHFPVGNTALCVYHSLNKLWHPRMIKVHNRCSFEATWDSQWWKWWNNSSLTRFVQQTWKGACDTNHQRAPWDTRQIPSNFPWLRPGKNTGAMPDGTDVCAQIVSLLFLTHAKRLWSMIYILHICDRC